MSKFDQILTAMEVLQVLLGSSASWFQNGQTSSQVRTVQSSSDSLWLDYTMPSGRPKDVDFGGLEDSHDVEVRSAPLFGSTVKYV